MKSIVYDHNTLGKISLPFVWNKGRPKRFFFFGDSWTTLTRLNNKSWTIKVSDYFNATSYNWGVPGGSEQSIFYTFAKNIDEERDFTFIFHTHPQRVDKFFNLQGIPMNLAFYKKWDEMITFPCIHLYWSSFNYEFQNGKTLFCTPLDSYQDQPIKVSPQGNLHHMTFKDNILLADKLIDSIKTMVDSKT